MDDCKAVVEKATADYDPSDSWTQTSDPENQVGVHLCGVSVVACV